jgi:hypothetical protein
LRPKTFHFVNTSAQERGCYNRSERSFVLKGHVYAKERPSDKRKHHGEVAVEGTTPRETLSSNKRPATHRRAKCPVRSVEPINFRELSSQRGTSVYKFQQGPGDPFQCFGRSIDTLEMQLIQERMRIPFTYPNLI